MAVSGEGPDVVLLHGFPHTRRLWTAITPELTGSHRVVAPDLRGTGGSTRAPSGYDAATLRRSSSPSTTPTGCGDSC